jgi:2-polyprenyl-6-methoxyphenol hydroxylase-like FAD-dependent oxidoreductase
MAFSNGFDVVIVGAGVAGGAMGTRLARDGFSVLILERTQVHADRIRGEWLAPWGVAEAMQLGLFDELLAAGGHFVTKYLMYADGIPIEAARAGPLDLATLVPNVAGAMTLGHPRLCDVLDQAAQRAGATLVRGIANVTIEAGLPPTVAFDHEGDRHTIRSRLVIGADGRGSPVARQVGAQVQTEPVHHLIAGLLIEAAHAWPEDEQTVGVHAGKCLYVFPQGNGRVRLYLCYSHEERDRFAGPSAAENFLKAFRVPSLPFADDIADGRIAGPCIGYPNADTWVDEPIAPGVVLIGDAAGHNDPAIGQGLSITFRDVRLVSEALSRSPDWNEQAFAEYATERRERMRRLRQNARLWAKSNGEFDAASDRTRAEVWRKITEDPGAIMPLLAPFVGPFALPPETFEEPALKRLYGEQWVLTADGWPREATMPAG